MPAVTTYAFNDGGELLKTRGRITGYWNEARTRDIVVRSRAVNHWAKTLFIPTFVIHPTEYIGLERLVQQ
jgi:hypothetical protein